MSSARKLSVFVLESESASDLLDSRCEGHGVQEIVRLLEGKSVHRQVGTRAEFESELRIFARSGCDVLHISAHGNSECIALTNGETITWNELFTLLEPVINDKYLFLSSCSAFGSNRLIKLFQSVDQRPFVVFGTSQDVLWPQALLAWSAIYYAIGWDCGEPAEALKRSLAACYLATGCDFHAHVFVAAMDGDPPSDFEWKGSKQLHSFVKEIIRETMPKQKEKKPEQLVSGTESSTNGTPQNN